MPFSRTGSEPEPAVLPDMCPDTLEDGSPQLSGGMVSLQKRAGNWAQKCYA